MRIFRFELIGSCEIWIKFCICNFQTDFSDWWLRHLLWNCHNMNVIGLHYIPTQWSWWRVYWLAEWRSGSVSALPCERPEFGPRTRLREIIPANNCTMQGQNNWGNWGSLGVMKLWVAQGTRSYVAEVFIRSWLRHPTTVSSMWTLPQIVKIQNGTKCNAIRKSPSGSIIPG